MKKKFIKFIFVYIFLMPIVSFLLIGVFSVSALKDRFFAEKNGGGFYVGSNTTLNFNATISGSSATNGGGVYVSNGGTFNMNGGAIYGNTATENGNNIYNAGTFTMTGGSVGEQNSSLTGYGIYNTGTMNLYGGTVYDNIYSSANINTKRACNIAGTITLGDNATITLQDYAGTTPNYAINLSNTRVAGTILTFVGSSTQPDLTKLNISGYDTDAFEIVSEKNSSGKWTVALKVSVNEYNFPTEWKTQVASTTYMTTTITPANLTKIQFVDSVPTGYTKIGTLSTGLSVYQGTTATEIVFVGLKIYAPADSSNLFENLSALTSINFSVFSTSNVTNMYSMFSGCNNLTSLDLSNFNTTKVTDMSGMFSGCSSLINIDISNFDTSKVTYMSGMFYSCSSLTSLSLNNFNTSKITEMRLLFGNCSSLTSLDLGAFDTSKVTAMEGMFQSCSNLVSLNHGTFDTSNVTNMGYMFNSCSSLTSLDLSNFDTSKVTNMDHMFYGCSKLTSLDLSMFNMANVTEITNMLSFGSSNRIEVLKTPYNNQSAIAITTGSTLYKNGTSTVVSSVPAGTSQSEIYYNHVHSYSSSGQYVSDGETGHHYETTYICSICSYTYTSVGTTSSHSTTTTTRYIQGIDNHTVIITTTCQNCTYSTTTRRKEAHSYDFEGKCPCGASIRSGGLFTVVRISKEEDDELDVILGKDKTKK